MKVQVHKQLSDGKIKAIIQAGAVTSEGNVISNEQFELQNKKYYN